MFFEPGQYPDEKDSHVYTLGFTEPPGGKNGSNLHVLNDHTYCCQYNNTVCATGEPPVDAADLCL